MREEICRFRCKGVSRVVTGRPTDRFCHLASYTSFLPSMEPYYYFYPQCYIHCYRYYHYYSYSSLSSGLNLSTLLNLCTSTTSQLFHILPLLPSMYFGTLAKQKSIATLSPVSSILPFTPKMPRVEEHTRN